MNWLLNFIFNIYRIDFNLELGSIDTLVHLGFNDFEGDSYFEDPR